MSAQCRLALLLALTGLAIVAGRLLVAAAPPPAGAQVPSLSISAVAPSTAANDVDTTLAITGTGFSAGLSGTQVIAPPAVFAGGVRLKQVTWLDSTRLDAVMQWGLVPSIYDMTVVNPDGESATLPQAVTITQGIGVWTTGGPYGGSVVELAIDPVVTATFYANLDFMGLFKSEDRGEHWANIYPAYVHCFGLKPGAPQTIYMGTDTPQGPGFVRSTDGGGTWQTIRLGDERRMAVTPADPEALYIGGGPSIQRSLDGGDTWQGATGDWPGDVEAEILAVHPGDRDVVYAGGSNGQVYKTVDGGQHWEPAGSGFGDTWWRALVIDPHEPERLYAAGWHGAEFTARSLDGGDTWEPMEPAPDVAFANDLQVHPTLPGTLYALAFNSLHRSADWGATWEPVSLETGGWRLALHPDSGLPHAIGHNGRAFYRSDDGGLHWQEAIDGLAGVQPADIAASPADDRFVYVAADDAGGFVTNDGGRSWRTMGGDLGMLNSVAADPLSPTVAYAGGGNTIYKTADGGLTWTAYPLPDPGYGQTPRVTTIAIDPHDRRRVYAGTGIWDFTGGPEPGWLHRSDDGGETWQAVTITLPISPVTGLAIDPADPQVLYLSTGRRWLDSTDRGSGIVKSTDGGQTWAYANEGLAARNITRVAIDAADRNVVYSGANPYRFALDAGVYASADAGAGWDLVLGVMRVSGLEADPGLGGTLYAGSYWNGLWRSDTGGASWARFDGALGWLSSLCLDVVQMEDRTVLYAGVSGGVYQGEVRAGREPAGDEFYGSGVYRIVLDRRAGPRLYLPLVVRGF